MAEKNTEAKWKVEILEMEKGEKMPTLATFKVRLTLNEVGIGTFPGMRLVKGVEGQPDFVASQDHYHFKVKSGPDKGKVKYVHCQYLFQHVYDAILPYAKANFANIQVVEGKDEETN